MTPHLAWPWLTMRATASPRVQVPLVACLTKFDGSTEQEMMNGDKRQYVITQLPKYLIVHIKRFSQNTQHFSEKNPTIVNFPVSEARPPPPWDPTFTAH